MKKLILLLTIIFSSLGANSTECSKYLADIYCTSDRKIVSQKEFIDNYEQKIGDYKISAVVYGYGYMKKHKCKKTRITYVTLLDPNGKPVWGYVIPH